MRKAFTLAEVLITLGIIGVVAAMTIPTLVTNYQKHLTVTRLKHAYSVLAQAVQMSETDHGSIEEWTWPSKARDAEVLLPWIQEYIVPYVKNTSVYTYKTEHVRMNLNNSTEISFWYNGGKELSAIVMWDLNKGENIGKNVFPLGFGSRERYGKNVFPFMYIQSNSNPDYSNRSTWKDDPHHGCNKWHDKRLCAGLIMHDGWKIAPDYPW